MNPKKVVVCDFLPSLLKSDSHLSKKMFYLQHPLKNDEKRFLFYSKSSKDI